MGSMRILSVVMLALATLPLAGCELVGDIFKAGVWVGVLAVVGLIAIIGFIAARIRS
jgi:hypothetical protein